MPMDDINVFHMVTSRGSDMSSLSATHRLQQLQRELPKCNLPRPAGQVNDRINLSQPSTHHSTRRSDYLQDWVKSVSANGSKHLDGHSPRLLPTSSKVSVTSPPKPLQSNYDTVRKQARVMLITLCRTMLDYDSEICIEGTIGITVDRKSVVLLHFNDSVEKPSRDQAFLVSNDNVCDHAGFDSQCCEDKQRTVCRKESLRMKSISTNSDAVCLTGHDNCQSTPLSNDVKSEQAENIEMFEDNDHIKFEPVEDEYLNSTEHQQSQMDNFDYEEEFASAREGESEGALDDDEWVPDGHESEMVPEDEEWAPEVQHQRRATKYKRHVESKGSGTTKMTLLRELLLQRTPLVTTVQYNSSELGRMLTSTSATTKRQHLKHDPHLIRKCKRPSGVQDKGDKSDGVEWPNAELSIQAPSNRSLETTSHIDGRPILGRLLTEEGTSKTGNPNWTGSSSQATPHLSFSPRQADEDRTSRCDPSFKSVSGSNRNPTGQATLMDLLPQSYQSPRSFNSVTRHESSQHPMFTASKRSSSNQPSLSKRASTDAAGGAKPPTSESGDSANFMYTRLLHKLVDSRNQDETRLIVPHMSGYDSSTVEGDYDSLASAMSDRCDERLIDEGASSDLPKARRGNRKFSKNNPRLSSLLQSGPSKEMTVDMLDRSCVGQYPDCDTEQYKGLNSGAVVPSSMSIKTEASSSL